MDKKAYKVLVIGMDGATFDVINPMVKKGKLPVLAQLMANGISSPLRSTFPPVTAPAWVSFMTGKNPGKHGVFDFCGYTSHGYTRPFVSSRDVQSKTIWKLLSEKGCQVGAVNVPITYPPEEVNGFIIPGYQRAFTHKEYTYPPELFYEIEKLGYELDYSGDLVPFTDDKTDYIQGWNKVVDARRSTSVHLMKKYNWDFFMTVYKVTDEVQHHFWKYYDKTYSGCSEELRQRYGSVIEDFYQKVDSAIGEQMSLLDESSVVVIMSDHGAGPLDKHFNLNRWLIQEGYMKLHSFRYLGLARLRYSYLYYKVLRRLGVKGIVWTIPRSIPAGTRRNMDPRMGLDNSEIIDWDNTRVYMGSVTEQGIYINLKGREINGIVSLGQEYERLREELIGKLLEVRDPETGNKIVEKVFKREDIYHGPCADNAADLFLLLKDEGRYILDSSLYQTTLFSPARIVSGTHRMDGVLIISGKMLKKGIILNRSSIEDIFPTIMHIMGFPVPDDLDGRVLTEAFEVSYLEERPVVYESASGDQINKEDFSYSDEDNDLIRKSLRSLGYI